MDYTNTEDDKSNPNNQGHPTQNSDLTRRPLHSVTTENAGSPPRQQPAATGAEGEASPQGNTPVLTTTDTGTASPHSASKPPNEPPVGNLIDFDSEPPKEDEVTAMMTGDVPMDLADPIKPTPPAPSQCNTTTHVTGQRTTLAAPQASTDATGKGTSSNKDDLLDEQMDTNEIH